MSNFLYDYDEYENWNSIIDDDNNEDSDNVDEVITKDSYITLIKNELHKLEVDRTSFEFNYHGEDIEGTPMAKINEDAIIFKINNKLKKIVLSEIEL